MVLSKVLQVVRNVKKVAKHWVRRDAGRFDAIRRTDITVVSRRVHVCVCVDVIVHVSTYIVVRYDGRFECASPRKHVDINTRFVVRTLRVIGSRTKWPRSRVKTTKRPLALWVRRTGGDFRVTAAVVVGAGGTCWTSAFAETSWSSGPLSRRGRPSNETREKATTTRHDTRAPQRRVFRSRRRFHFHLRARSCVRHNGGTRTVSPPRLKFGSAKQKKTNLNFRAGREGGGITSSQCC